MRGEGIDATLSFRSEADRERARGEILAAERERELGREPAREAPALGTGLLAADAAPADVSLTEPARRPLSERLGAAARAERPWTITLAALLLVGLGIVTAIGAFTTADAVEIVQPPVAVALRLAVAVAAAAAFVASAFGIYTGRQWGRVLVVNLALVGLFLAFVSLVSSQVCLQPVGPTQSCRPEREAIDRLVSLVTLATLAFGLWAVASGARFFGDTSASPQPALH